MGFGRGAEGTVPPSLLVQAAVAALLIWVFDSRLLPTTTMPVRVFLSCGESRWRMPRC